MGGVRSLRYSGPGVVHTEDEKRRLALEQTTSPVAPPQTDDFGQETITVYGTPPPDPVENFETSPDAVSEDLPADEYAAVASDPRAAMTKARAEGDAARGNSRFWSGVAEINGALGGTAPNYRYAKDLAADAERPEARARQDMDLEAAAAKARAQNEANDPNSATNQRARELVSKTFPGFAGKMGTRFGSMTQSQLSAALGLDQKAGDIAFKDRQQTESERHNRAMENRVSFGASASNGVGERFSGTNLAKFNTAVADLIPLVSTLQEIERMAPGTIKGKVDPANTVGAIDRLVLNRTKGIGPRMMANAEQKAKLDSAFRLVKDLYAKGVIKAGANFTPQEMERVDAIFKDGALAADPEIQAATLDLIRRGIGRQVKMLEAGPKTIVSPQMWQQYIANGGLDSSNSIFQDAVSAVAPRAAAPAPAPAQAPNVPAGDPLHGKRIYQDESGQWVVEE